MYVRVMEPGIGIDDLRNWRSRCGATDPATVAEDDDICAESGYALLDGVCVSDDEGEESFGGAASAYDDNDECVYILDGEFISRIYDGVLIRPTRIVATMTLTEWMENGYDGW